MLELKYYEFMHTRNKGGSKRSKYLIASVTLSTGVYNDHIGEDALDLVSRDHE